MDALIYRKTNVMYLKALTIYDPKLDPNPRGGKNVLCRNTKDLSVIICAFIKVRVCKTTALNTTSVLKQRNNEACLVKSVILLCI